MKVGLFMPTVNNGAGRLTHGGMTPARRPPSAAGRGTACVPTPILTTGERIEADVIVLAAGAVGSPIILQRSGVGPADVLERHGIDVIHPLEAVGRNLRDHPMLYPTWSADVDAVGPLDPPLQAFCVARPRAHPSRTRSTSTSSRSPWRPG